MDTRTERYRRIRGAILKILAKEHPGTLDSKVVGLLLGDLGYTIRDEECEGHLAYLAEKGFASVNERRSAGIEIRMATITAKGLDLIDELITDIGVDVRF